MRLLFNAVFTLFITLSLLVLHACTWKITDTASDTSAVSQQLAKLEKLKGRRSPGVKTFYHVDLDIYKEVSGSRWNDLGAPYLVEFPPGKVQIGVVFPKIPYIYYPEVEFEAKPGHNYWLTWVCAPYPYVVIVDALTSRVVALDTYCAVCQKLIGLKISPDNECLLKRIQPPWMKPDETTHWMGWYQERTNQMFRDLCRAAEQDIKIARKRLGTLYTLGMYGVPQDTVLGNFWYTSDLDDLKLGECEKELTNSPQKYQLKSGYQPLIKDW